MERQDDSFVRYNALSSVEVRRHTFLTSQLRGDDLSASLPCRLSPSDTDRTARCTEGHLDCTANLGDSKKRES
jgi:hypothetical protein